MQQFTHNINNNNNNNNKNKNNNNSTAPDKTQIQDTSNIVSSLLSLLNGVLRLAPSRTGSSGLSLPALVSAPSLSSLDDICVWHWLGTCAAVAAAITAQRQHQHQHQHQHQLQLELQLRPVYPTGDEEQQQQHHGEDENHQHDMEDGNRVGDVDQDQDQDDDKDGSALSEAQSLPKMFGSSSSKVDVPVSISMLWSSIPATDWYAEWKRIEALLTPSVSSAAAIEDHRRRADMARKLTHITTITAQHITPTMHKFKQQWSDCLSRISSHERLLDKQPTVQQARTVYGASFTRHQQLSQQMEHTRTGVEHAEARLAQLEEQLQHTKNVYETTSAAVHDEQPLRRIKQAIQTLQRDCVLLDRRAAIANVFLQKYQDQNKANDKNKDKDKERDKSITND